MTTSLIHLKKIGALGRPQEPPKLRPSYEMVEMKTTKLDVPWAME